MIFTKSNINNANVRSSWLWSSTPRTNVGEQTNKLNSAQNNSSQNNWANLYN